MAETLINLIDNSGGRLTTTQMRVEQIEEELGYKFSLRINEAQYQFILDRVIFYNDIAFPAYTTTTEVNGLSIVCSVLNRRRNGEILPGQPLHEGLVMSMVRFQDTRLQYLSEINLGRKETLFYSDPYADEIDPKVTHWSTHGYASVFHLLRY